MALRTIAILWFTVMACRACDCIVLPARQARNYAEIVFQGTVTGFRHPDSGETRVVFHVSRVWKGPVTTDFEMLAVQGVDCMSFSAGLLKVGNELLVYAHRIQGSDFLPRPGNLWVTGRRSDTIECSFVFTQSIHPPGFSSECHGP